VTAAPRVIDAAKDRWITTRLRSLLIADGTIRDSNYAIDTSNGTIYLNGIAQDEAERERILRHARSIGEARKVVDYVIMKDDPRRQEARAANIVLDDAAPSGAGP
jgi:osmotically-inducible protein OsmY